MAELNGVQQNLEHSTPNVLEQATADERKTREMEAYLNTLEEVKDLLKKPLDKEGNTIELEPISSDSEEFDFAGATKSLQNLKEALKYFQERGTDLSKHISQVSLGPALAYDPLDKTLILSPGNSIGQIEVEIDNIIALDKDGQVETTSPQMEEASRTEAEMPNDNEENQEESIDEVKKRVTRDVLKRLKFNSEEEIPAQDYEAFVIDSKKELFGEVEKSHMKRLAELMEQKTEKFGERFLNYFEKGRNWWSSFSRAEKLTAFAQVLLITGGATGGTYLGSQKQENNLKAQEVIVDTASTEGRGGERKAKLLEKTRQIPNVGENLLADAVMPEKIKEPEIQKAKIEDDNEMLLPPLKIEVSNESLKILIENALNKYDRFAKLSEDDQKKVIDKVADRDLQDPEKYGIPRKGWIWTGDKINQSELLGTKVEIDELIDKALKSSALNNQYEEKIIDFWKRHPDADPNNLNIDEILNGEPAQAAPIEKAPEPQPEPKPEEKEPFTPTINGLENETVGKIHNELPNQGVAVPRPQLHAEIRDALSKPAENHYSANTLEESGKKQMVHSAPVIKSMQGDMFHINHPYITQAFMDDLNKVFGKKGRFGIGYTNGIDTPEWKAIQDIPALDFEQFFSKNSEDSSLDPEKKQILLSSQKYRDLFDVVSDIESHTDGMAVPRNGEKVRDYMLRAGTLAANVSRAKLAENQQVA